MAVKSALRASRPLPPRKFLVLSSVRGWVDPRAIVRLKGLGQLKNPVTSSGTKLRDLPACSIAPQPTTLPRAPFVVRGFPNHTVCTMEVNVKFERAWFNLHNGNTTRNSSLTFSPYVLYDGLQESWKPLGFKEAAVVVWEIKWLLILCHDIRKFNTFSV
jgi:hypothetical protein